MHKIFTSCDRAYSLNLLDFLITLIHIGEWKDEIVVLDYGVNEELKKKILLNYTNVEFITCETEENRHINGKRFIDMKNYLKTKPGNYKVAHFDADMWFQRDVNSLFKLDRVGMTYAPEYNFFDKSVEDYVDLINIVSMGKAKDLNSSEKLWELIHLSGGFINGGFFYGTRESVINLVDNMLEYERREVFKLDRLTNQILMNLLFDKSRDFLDGYKWNTLLYPGYTTIKNNKFESIWSDDVAVCHNYGGNPFKYDTICNALYFYSDLYKREIDKLEFKEGVVRLSIDYYKLAINGKDQNFIVKKNKFLNYIEKYLGVIQHNDLGAFHREIFRRPEQG